MVTTILSVVLIVLAAGVAVAGLRMWLKDRKQALPFNGGQSVSPATPAGPGGLAGIKAEVDAMFADVQARIQSRFAAFKTRAANITLPDDPLEALGVAAKRIHADLTLLIAASKTDEAKAALVAFEEIMSTLFKVTLKGPQQPPPTVLGG